MAAEPKKKSKHGLSRISIIFGVGSFWMAVRQALVFGLPLGFCAIIVGAVAVGKGDNRGYIGIVLGIIGAIILTFPFFY